jgi:GDP-L-fucose synthase
VEDLAKAVLHVLEHQAPEHLYNVGTGQDLSIKALAETIQRLVGHKGAIVWDASKPDGTPRKLMDVSKMQDLGWKHQIELEAGIASTYDWYLQHQETFKQVKIDS